jgi:hypothetical protein
VVQTQRSGGDGSTGRRPGADARRDPGIERVFAGYYLLQAVVGVAFWIAIESVPAVRTLVDIAPDRHVIMDAWIFADGVIVLASLASAWAVERQTSWVVPIAAFTAGCVVYPTVFLIGWVAFTEVGAGSLITMVPPSILSCWVAFHLWSVRRDD